MKKTTKAGITLSAFCLLGFTGAQIYAEEIEEVEEVVGADPNISYYSHISNIGDTESVENGEVTGTEDPNLQMEALCIELDPGDYTGDIEYSAHVSNIGWMDYVSSSELAGTKGQSLPMEAVKIHLTEELANNYDVYYSSKIADYGWMGWASNDQESGSSGLSIKMEAIKILIQRKGSDAPVSDSKAYITDPLNCQAYVSDKGWLTPVSGGQVTGTTGQDLAMEAIKLNLNNAQYEGDIEYSAYVSGIGWQDYVSGSGFAGTIGQAAPMEAIKIRLTGDIANYYDVYYRVHSSNVGWQGWTCNDQAAGTFNYGQHMEAAQIQLINKSKAAPEMSDNAFQVNYLNYQAHVSNIGWMNPVSEGQTAGTTGQSLPMEAIKIQLEHDQYEGDIEYSVFVTGKGWQDYVFGTDFAGTIGQSTPIEAIKVRLIGDIANHYDICYRTHSSNFGWQGWAYNDDPAGTVHYGEHIESLQLRLVESSAGSPESSDTAFYANNLNYQAHVSNIGWMDYVFDGNAAGTTTQDFGIEALRISLNNIGGEVLYKSYNSLSGWEETWKAQDEVSGTTGIATALEAIQIKLSDDIASLYDIFYRVHVAGLGWFDWVSNGTITGTVNQNRAIKAIEITLNKNRTADTSSTVTYGEGNTYYIGQDLAESWHKIYGYNYYFENGHMITNQVIDGRVIDEDGRENTSPALNYARNVLNEIGWNLKSGYDWVIKSFSYQQMVEDPALGSDWYAQNCFETGVGNCYSFSAIVYEMGLLLGYDIHQVSGSYLRSIGPSVHSWLEVIVDGETYIVDPDFEKELGRNGYFITYGAPGTLRYHDWSRMN